MFKLTYVEALLASDGPIFLDGRWPSRAWQTMWRRAQRTVKPSYRYRLNRLAEALVTPGRFDWGWTEYDGPIFDEWDAVSAEVLLRVNRVIATGPTPGEFEVDLTMPPITVDEANAEVQGMIAQKIRDEGPQCPYGNPGCFLPDAPIGRGLHGPCLKRQSAMPVASGWHRESVA